MWQEPFTEGDSEGSRGRSGNSVAAAEGEQDPDPQAHGHFFHCCPIFATMMPAVSLPLGLPQCYLELPQPGAEPGLKGCLEHIQLR